MFFSMPGCILPLERALSCGNGAVSLMRKWQAYDGDACDLAGFPVILAEAGAWHGLCGRGGCRLAEGRRSASRRRGTRGEAGRAAGGLWLSVRPQGIEKSFDKLFNLEKILNHGKNNRYRPGNY